MPITPARTGNPADANPAVAGARAVIAGRRAGTTAIVGIVGIAMTAGHAATGRAMQPAVIGPSAKGHVAVMIAVESRNVRKHRSWT